MASGLLALLDDVVAIAKVAAASLDDVAAQAAKAGSKAAGIVIDDAAVAPRYVVGFAAERELPIIGKIALGSIRNKLLFLLPGALLLSTVAPWSITPLLVGGGLFLCFEGFRKVHEVVVPGNEHATEHTTEHADEDSATSDVGDAAAVEQKTVTSAIRTDLILSAEIMALTLSTLDEASFVTKASVLLIVGLGITVAIYAAVALIVKADDIGVALARRSAPWSVLGRGLVNAMPAVLSLLSIVGTVAMLWVGGGIILHGLAVYGISAPEHWIHTASEAASTLQPAAGGLLGWTAGAALAAVAGLLFGAAVGPVVRYVIEPLLKRLPRFGRSAVSGTPPRSATNARRLGRRSAPASRR